MSDRMRDHERKRDGREKTARILYDESKRSDQPATYQQCLERVHSAARKAPDKD